MPRFYFHTHDVRDEVGLELADAGVARVEAITTLAQLLPAWERDLRAGRPVGVKVTNDKGALEFTIETTEVGASA